LGINSNANIYKSNEHEIEGFYLPSYSPELNPDEYLNCDLKSGQSQGPIKEERHITFTQTSKAAGAH
jgi:hypothetical protein